LVQGRKLRSLVLGNRDSVEGVFGPERLTRLAECTSFVSDPVTPADWATIRNRLQDLEVIFGTWNLPAFTAADMEFLPKLKAVFYAAGTVRYFAQPLIERGVEIFSAASANAIPVAEFALGQILLANKGFFRVSRAYTTGREAAPGRGNFGTTIALLGAGEVGRALIERLKPFAMRVIVFDPLLSPEGALALGVEKVELDEAFARGDVVSNHLADLPPTREMLRGRHFSAMPRDATFINTGRGATVCEAELIEILRSRPDLSALLDVTEPEPPKPDSPFWTLPNVHLSPHLAGSIGRERERMADLAIQEFDAWRAGAEVRTRSTPELLARMA
jgi:phosphoglycerate dehydrogenase-like enzyme